MDINIGGLLSLVTLGSKVYNFPPSPPKTHWVRGNFGWEHNLPIQHGFLQVEEWIKEYGPVITIRQGGQTLVIVGRHKAAIEILEKQGDLTVDRPSRPAADLLSGGLRFSSTPGGENTEMWWKMRRAAHTHLRPMVAASYDTIQVDHVKNTILDLLDDPEHYDSHAKRYIAAVLQKIAYGKNTPTSVDDPEVKQAFTSLHRSMYVTTPGRYIVNTLPFLKYMPWYGRDLRKWCQDDVNLYTMRINRVKKEIESGEDAGPSFARYALENQVKSGLSELQIAYVAASIFEGGAVATSLSICLMILSAALHPEAQAKVQAELDVMIGFHRAPTFADKSTLPYLQAFILESFRWRPVLSPGASHKTNADVTWGEYSIPCGTTIVGNNWAISRDPDVFPNPEEFQPERWLTSESKIRNDIKFPIFGFGRRECPGQHVANRSVFINIVHILWAFRLSVDPNEPIDDLAFTGETIPTLIPKVVFERRMDDKAIRSMVGA